ncbi:MAG: MBL fold metallo-hydrolase [Candidatus Bathyarchaeota archaeon]|nr:MBL fold metallo-hydrolase [Candidatus Bathyarchaeota archaeon]MCZ2844978.1 MBL fold metallo-hydrolase [Candidatus Bathyarchaeota archaeon]
MTVLIKKDENLQIEKMELGSFGTNSYIIIAQNSQDAVLIDAPDEANKILDRLKGINLRYILLTHNHMDHIGALSLLKQKLKIPLATHPFDAQNLSCSTDILLADGDTISFGNLELKVIHTPGHTPGSLCFLLGNYLFSGDTIFPGGPGKTWSPSDFEKIIESIKNKIFVLPEDTKIYPGHGDSTLIKEEKEKFEIFSSKPHDPNIYGDVTWLS